MVAGGPYGLEDLIGKAGYRATLIILLLTPLLWSIPTALMVSELAAALPCEGGFYVWVRRGLGPFWGFQETWLTLTGSVFEMALYPTLFVAYLSRFAPQFAAGYRAIALELALIALCAGWNILGARAVGEGSIWLNALLFSPFLAIVVIALDSVSHAAVAIGSDPAFGPGGRHRHRHVELHGLGQSFHDRRRGGPAANDVPARHVRCGHLGDRQLFVAGDRRRGGAARPWIYGRPAVGWMPGRRWAVRFWRWRLLPPE